jgi:hypothetical protein
MTTQGTSKNRLPQQNITLSQVQTLRRLGLHYDISYQAIICIPCGFALKTDDDRVGRHLEEKHGISKKRRQKLNALVNSLLKNVNQKCGAFPLLHQSEFQFLTSNFPSGNAPRFFHEGPCQPCRRPPSYTSQCVVISIMLIIRKGAAIKLSLNLG